MATSTSFQFQVFADPEEVNLEFESQPGRGDG